MTEQLISYETAKLAKEKGFRGYCNGYYYKDEGNCSPLYCYYSDGLWGNDFNDSESCQCPSQSLLQKWLREKHDIYIDVIHQDKDCTLYEYIVYRTFEERVNSICDFIRKEKERKSYNTYEDALESALKEALKLIE